MAVDQAYSVDEDSTLAVDAPGVLAGSSDADGAAPAIAELVAGVQHGSLALQPNGSFVYVPAANFNGTDSFTYAAKDAEGNPSAAATVTITVGAFFSFAPSVAPGPPSPASCSCCLCLRAFKSQHTSASHACMKLA